jgi:hypothetical protein
MWHPFPTDRELSVWVFITATGTAVASLTTNNSFCNVEALCFYEAGRVVFNSSQTTHFGDKTTSVLDSGDVSFFLLVKCIGGLLGK